MRLAVAILLALAARAALADCTPAAADVVAAAEREASDAEHQADQAESVAVRSGNPGADARARLARQKATAARRHVDELRCRPPAAPAPSPAPGLLRGY